MKRMAPWIVGGLLLSVVGCGGDPYRPYRLGAAQPVVGRCIDMMGGLKRWRSVKPIRAHALVTMYDSAGQATVNEQDQVIDLRRGKIRATARVPDGEWTATVRQSGKGKLEAEGFDPSEQMTSQVVAALRMTLHRVRGPLNLCGRGERAVNAQPVRLTGEDLIRVPVTGGREGIAAYYFDARTSLLRFATAGADAPGGEGTVTVYSYRVAPNGMAFPSRISVMKIGRHVLIGDAPVLEVEYRQVRF